jgi:hypothetical protein
MTTTPNRGVPRTPASQAVIDALIQQGIEYAIAEDKWFMAGDQHLEGVAHGGHQATVKALAIVLGVTEAEAAKAIILAQRSGERDR